MIPRGRWALCGVGRGTRGVGYGLWYMPEWYGQPHGSHGLMPIEVSSRGACYCRDEEIEIARVPKRARLAPITRDRISTSRAFRKASVGRNRCTEERERHRRGTVCDGAVNQIGAG